MVAKELRDHQHPQPGQDRSWGCLGVEVGVRPPFGLTRLVMVRETELRNSPEHHLQTSRPLGVHAYGCIVTSISRIWRETPRILHHNLSCPWGREAWPSIIGANRQGAVMSILNFISMSLALVFLHEPPAVGVRNVGLVCRMPSLWIWCLSLTGGDLSSATQLFCL